MRVVRIVLASLVFGAVCTYAQPGRNRIMAKGTFEVKMTPQEATSFEKALAFTRFHYNKNWQGDFEGTSEGEMLANTSENTGAMAYVALEHMDGKLAGRSGTFLLAHQATMMRSDATSGIMAISVVPNSATGELKGLSGTLTIQIDAAGKHSWTFAYSLPPVG